MSDVFGGYTRADVKVCRITSITTRKSAEINRIVSSIDVFMSIYEPTVTAVMVIEDTTGLIYDLPIIGEEVVSLEVETPNMPAISKTFYVYGAPEIEQDSNNTKTRITLHLVSIDHIRGISNLIEHGMKDTLGELVKNILTNDIKTPAPIYVEPTKGIETFAPAGWNIWETIDILRQRAVSVKYDSPYLFFEDNQGYNFVSVEGLIEKKKAEKEPVKITSIPFNPGAGEGADKSTLTDSQYRNVDSFRIVEKANIASTINNGGMSNSTQVFDILQKAVTTIDRHVKDFSATIKQPLDDAYNAQHSELWTSVIKAPVIKYLIPFDSTNGSEFVSQYGQRRMFHKHFNSLRVGFTMYGDTSLNPGDLLNISIPRTINDESDDVQLSGNFIVSHLRHVIVDGEMLTMVEANRFGFVGSVV